MTDPNFREKREFSRVPVLLYTRLTSDTQQVSIGHVHDLSARGVLFSGNPLLPEGTPVQVELYTQGPGEGLTIRARGRIERCTVHGHGVEFLEIEAESWDYLQQLIYLHADNPDRVRAEFMEHHGLKRRKKD